VREEDQVRGAGFRRIRTRTPAHSPTIAPDPRAGASTVKLSAGAAPLMGGITSGLRPPQQLRLRLNRHRGANCGARGNSVCRDGCSQLRERAVQTLETSITGRELSSSTRGGPNGAKARAHSLTTTQAPCL
jgi:hypothetical protein